MVANKKQRRPKVNRKPRKHRRRATRTSQAKPALGKLIAKGVKSLVSSVPVIGSVLDSVADFAFKAFGITNSTLERAFDAVQVDHTALVARFHITPACLLVGSRNCIQIDMGRKVMTQYRDGRVINVTVKVQPINPVSKRNGDWSLALQPFFASEDRGAAGLSSTWNPTEQGMHHMYLSVSGPASQPLTLTYSPKMADGLAYHFMPLDSTFAEVVIRWEQPIRSTYATPSADDFACETIISGTLEQRLSAAMPPNNSGGYTITTTVVDVIKPVGMFIKSIPMNTTFQTFSSVKCEDREKFCLVSGELRLPGKKGTLLDYPVASDTGGHSDLSKTE